ncbi:MAG: methionyl-tRNA formyltransferase [Minisyncoccota bacterium]
MRTLRDIFHLPIYKTTPIPSQMDKHHGNSSLSVSPQIRVVFMGTPDFSASLLSSLIAQQYNIVSVFTKPDRPIGRKQEIQQSAVKKIAIQHDILVEQPEKFTAEVIQKIASLKPDLIIVVAYGKILPLAVLRIPGFGCINVHASLLPKWRGASPVQNALLTGAEETGATIILMDEGMDTGNILAQRSLHIHQDETRVELMSRILSLAETLLLETIPLWITHAIEAKKQDNNQATLCQLIEREDGHILWTDEALSIYNRFRALSSWPGIFVFWKKDGELLRLKLHKISYQKMTQTITHPIGQVFELSDKIGVQTTSGIIFLEEVQLAGKNRMSIREFLLGNPDFIGTFLQ